MTVNDLIIMLKKANPDDIVKTFDGDSKQLEEVSGMIYGGKDCIVELCTDDNN